MVIEWLRFRVPVADQARFTALDAEIWTRALARNAGFLGKEVWTSVADPEEMNLIIRWNRMADWKAVPRTLLDETEAAFTAAFGRAVPVDICLAYEVSGGTG